MLNENEANKIEKYLSVETPADKAIVINDELVTPEYLIAHGFKQYWGRPNEEYLPYGYPYHGVGYSYYLEKEMSRQMFAIVISGEPIALLDVSNFVSVYVQEDAGCGFIQIPFPWTELSVEFFEAVYYGIRGYKPKKV